jgi:hypothetical protein
VETCKSKKKEKPTIAFVEAITQASKTSKAIELSLSYLQDSRPQIDKLSKIWGNAEYVQR